MANDILYLDIEDIIAIHQKQIEELGGADGYLHKDRLGSIVDQPKVTFDGEDLYPDIFAKAAAYIATTVNNHVFVDGNKRTAAQAAILFLFLNGYKIIEFHDLELAQKVLEFESNKIDNEDLADYLASHAKEV